MEIIKNDRGFFELHTENYVYNLSKILKEIEEYTAFYDIENTFLRFMTSLVPSISKSEEHGYLVSLIADVANDYCVIDSIIRDCRMNCEKENT